MCWKIPLQRRAKVAGVMDMVLSIIGITISSLDISKLIKNGDDSGDTADVLERDRSLILVYTIIAMSTVKFIMGFILWNGAKSRNVKLCVPWLYVSLGLWVMQVIMFTIKLILGSFVLLSTISHALALVIRIIVMYVVYRFIEEIRDGRIPVPINAEPEG